MDESNGRRWALSVLAALVVAAVLVGGWWLSRPGSAVEGGSSASAGTSGAPGTGGGGSGSNPGTGDPGAGKRGAGASDDRPAVGRDPVLVEHGVRVDGYAARGTRLVLRYTTGVPACYGEVGAPRVAEDADSVTVTLLREPPETPAEVCIDLAVVGTVAVELSAPVGRRSVLDGAFEPAVRVQRLSSMQVTPGDPT